MLSMQYYKKTLMFLELAEVDDMKVLRYFEANL